MAYALVDHCKVGCLGGGSTTSPAINSTGASLLVVVFTDYAFGIRGVLSDSYSNTWTLLTMKSGNGRVQICYAESPVVGAGHTITVTGSNFQAMDFAAFSGAQLVAPFDAENGAASSGTTIQPGSITPSVNDELVIAGLCWQDAGACAVNSGMTITDQNGYVFFVQFGTALAYIIQTTAGAINPTWTIGAADCQAVIACFKSGTSPPPPSGGGSIVFIS